MCQDDAVAASSRDEGNFVLSGGVLQCCTEKTHQARSFPGHITEKPQRPHVKGSAVRCCSMRDRAGGEVRHGCSCLDVRVVLSWHSGTYA